MGKGYTLAAVAACALSVGLAGPASAATPTDTTALQDAVGVGNGKTGIRKHLKQLQVIADANNGTRATGTKGHEDSVAYVRKQLEATGYYDISTQPFTATVFNELAPPTLTRDPGAQPGLGGRPGLRARWSSRATAP